jgi:hypothetical protein
MHPTVPRMIDKTSPAGWVVQVITPGKASLIATPGGRRSGPGLVGPPSFRYFNVAIAAAGMAIEATTKQLAEDDDKETAVVRPLSSAEIATLKLKAGDVVPA